jgi:MoaA/NifB/PqqE/SkfB family radical SAM enzyme
MDGSRLLQLIDEFKQLGVFDVTLAGGEPSLHPQILEIIHRCVNAKIRVGMLSNGIALDEKMVAELERITNRQNFILQISIDSTNPEVNDAGRGKTRDVLGTLERLRHSSLQVQLACVIHKRNLATAHLLIDSYYPDIKRYHFLNIQRTAQALKHPELLIEEGDALRFWLHLNEYAKRFPEDLFLPSLRIQMRALGRAEVDPEASLHRGATFECASCSAGWSHINITSTFDVLGCDIAKDFTKMGNVFERSFESVWNSPEAERVRQAPFPACYKIEGPKGDKLEDSLKPEYVQTSANSIL